MRTITIRRTTLLAWAPVWGALSPGAGPAVAQDPVTVSGSFGGALSPGTRLIGFRSERHAEEELLRVLRHTGLRPNFLFGRDDRVPNAAAAMVLEGGRLVRAIAYNGQFMNDLRNAAGTDWSLIMVLAHEVGHHLQGHTVSPGGSTPPTELEADEYAGFVLARMGATLAEAQSAVSHSPPQASATHPGRGDRMRAVENGWRSAQDMAAAGGASSAAGSPPAAGSGAAVARSAAARLDSAVGDRLDEVDEIIRDDLARRGDDVTDALAESEVKVVGEVAAGTRETAEAVRAALAEEARQTTQAVAAQGQLTRQEVNRVMWLLLALSAVVLPLLLIIAFRKPRREVVRVVERASTRVRERKPRASVGARPRPNVRRLPTSPARLSPDDAPSLVLAAGPGGGVPRLDILIRGRELAGGGSGIVIGRHPPSVQAVVNDPTVSRRHARITREGGGFRIEDLGSSNGTKVNGVRLTPRVKHPIKVGDSVQLGGMRAFSVRLD